MEVTLTNLFTGGIMYIDLSTIISYCLCPALPETSYPRQSHTPRSEAGDLE